MLTKRDLDLLVAMTCGAWEDRDGNLLAKPSPVEIRTLVVLGMLQRREVADGVFAIELTQEGKLAVYDELAARGLI